MTYINEHISKEDWQKYDMDDLILRYEKIIYPLSNGWGWTIDREKNSYLIHIKTGHGFDDESGIRYFVFYWQGLDILVKTQIDGGGKRDSYQWLRYWLLQIDMDDIETPQEDQDRFKRDYDLMIADLKLALTAYKDFGIRSNSTEFDAFFEF